MSALPFRESFRGGLLPAFADRLRLKLASCYRLKYPHNNMSSNSKIEWTEATWNPVRGCVKVSPGCTHCYAESFAERFRNVPNHPYERGFDPRTVPEKLDEPLKWIKRKMIFVNS